MRSSITAVVAVVAALAFAAQSPAWAGGNKTGFDSDSSNTQGSGGKTNDNSNPDNNGQVTETTSGPKGQIDKGNTGCNNCETTTSGPGNK